MEPMFWNEYLFVEAEEYRRAPDRMLCAQGYSVLDWCLGRHVLESLCYDAPRERDRLMQAFMGGLYEDSRSTYYGLEQLLGPCPKQGMLTPPGCFAQLLILRRDPPRPGPKPVIEPIKVFEPAPLSDLSSWVCVECVDDSEAQRPVPYVTIEVITAAAAVRTATTNAEGVARIDRIAAGNVTIRLTELDGYLWRPLEGEDSTLSSESDRFVWHEVTEGQCLSQIARRYGFKYWQDVWRFHKNKDLRARRKSPQVLHPGDLVAVPALRIYQIRRQSAQTYRIEVQRRRVRHGHVLAERSLRFHHHSAVLLAEAFSEQSEQVRSDAPVFDVLAGTLTHAKQHPTQALLLAGHSEAAETPEGDRELSALRATCVRHLLRGDREAFGSLAVAHSCDDDLPAILRWCAETRGWDCAIDAGRDAADAVRAFQMAYNQSGAFAPIAENGVVGTETWSAFFDLYQTELAGRLDTDRDGLSELQSGLHFCDAAESIGCGEALSVHASRGADPCAYRSADAVFFERDESPSKHDLELCPFIGPAFELTPFSAVAPRVVRAVVRELVYPGTDADCVALEGKWLYAIADGALAFSLEAVGAQDFRLSRGGEECTEAIGDGRVPLQSDKSYQFFLSPIELSPRALERLLSRADQCLWLTSVERPASLRGDAGTLLVRDVFQWALDLHDRAYLPQLDPWHSWLADEERANRHFIASTLQLIIDQGDEPGIDGCLPVGQPARFLEQHARDEEQARTPAERAAFQLASFVDSEDHRIVEAAYTDAGEDGAEVAFMHWACVLGDLSQTFEGRQLLDVVAADEGRVPRQYVLADAPPTPLGFGSKRYLSLAGRALLKDLGPALVGYLYPNDTPSAREAVARYLERLGEAKLLRGTYRQIHQNIQKGRKLTHKLKNRKSLQKLIRVASRAEEATRVKIPEALVKSQRLAAAYERNLGALDASALVALEAVNLALALREALDEQSGASTLEKLAGALGAGADLGIAVIDAREVILRATTKTAKSVLGMISGICDVICFIQATRRAASRYDYNQAFGYGVAAFGAGFIFANSCAAFAAAVAPAGAASVGATAASTGAAAGALGTLIGTAASIAVGAGIAFAVLSADNAYQEFAKFCFLGEQSEESGLQFSWSPVALPARRPDGTRDLTGEAAALITLISNFQLEFAGASLVLIPQFYREGDVFEVYVEVHPLNYERNACVLEVDLTTEQVTQLSGLRPLRAASKVCSNAQGRVTRIEIDLRDAQPPPFPEVVQYGGGLARARLRFEHGGEKRFVPPVPPKSSAKPWLQVSADSDLGTLVSGSWRASSSNQSRHVDATKVQVGPDLERFHE